MSINEQYMESVLKCIDQKKNNVTFQDIEKQYENDGLPYEGQDDVSIYRIEGIVNWFGWNEYAIIGFNFASIKRRFNIREVSKDEYSMDGKSRDIPHYRSATSFTEKRWMPVAFDVKVDE